MNFSEFLKITSKIKNIPLPAEPSQNKMLPPSRMKSRDTYKEAMKQAKQSAVLALFYPSVNHQTKFALIQRKAYNGVHSAQISFPGGKVEENDLDLEYTAKRETHEEIGIAPEHVIIVKELTKIYIPPSNFAVQPFIGLLNETPNFILQETEVEELLEVSLKDFINEDNVITKTVSTSYNREVDVPAYLFNGHIVWGATAMMLSEVKDLLKAAF